MASCLPLCPAVPHRKNSTAPLTREELTQRNASFLLSQSSFADAYRHAHDAVPDGRGSVSPRERRTGACRGVEADVEVEAESERVQHAFLVECRKFSAFFKNNRGPKKNDMVVMNFVSKRFEPKLPVWAIWHEHINRHLMHLAYGRVGNETSWDGSANAFLLKEFTDIWAEFVGCLNPLYETEFVDQLRSRGL
jgi:hypothetical protein